MPPYMVEAAAVAFYVGMTYAIAKLVSVSGLDYYIFYALMTVLGLVGMGLWLRFSGKWKAWRGGSGGNGCYAAGHAGPRPLRKSCRAAGRERSR